jgi:hypothetical protein
MISALHATLSVIHFLSNRLKFAPPRKIGILFAGVTWFLIVAGVFFTVYGFYYLQFGEHPLTKPSLIHGGTELVYPEPFHLVSVNVTLVTYDAFAALNPIQLELRATVNNTQDISKLVLVMVPLSFNASFIHSSQTVSEFLTAAEAQTAVVNLTSGLPKASIFYNATMRVSEDGEYTLLDLTLLKSGLLEKGILQQPVVNILPYSALIEAEGVRQTAENTVVQTWVSYEILGLTLVVTALTMAQVIELRKV